MLYIETVESGTLSLLKKLMNVSSLQEFSLVGGTALALRFGHRSSIDLDLFCHEKFDHGKIQKELISEFGSDFVFESGHKNIGIFCNIRKIKVDIVYYPHQLIGDFVIEDKIRMYSSADIGAMKIQAILGRGKKKDLQNYNLQQLIDWHKQKYPSQMLAISIPNAITYFAEADESETPVSLKKQTWDQIKKGIAGKVSDYLR